MSSQKVNAETDVLVTGLPLVRAPGLLRPRLEMTEAEVEAGQAGRF